jgi:hypothetical protein
MNTKIQDGETFKIRLQIINQNDIKLNVISVIHDNKYAYIELENRHYNRNKNC